jgi:hypothetical protein
MSWFLALSLTAASSPVKLRQQRNIRRPANQVAGVSVTAAIGGAHRRPQRRGVPNATQQPLTKAGLQRRAGGGRLYVS